MQQINYWMGKANGRDYEGFKWIYITYAKFHEQFPDMSVRTIQRAVSSLKKQGVIVAKKEYELVPHSNRSTLHYRVDKVAIRGGQNDHIGLPKCPSKMDKMATPYKYKDNTDITREYRQKGSVPFSKKKEEQKILPKGSKKAKYTDGQMTHLFQKAEKWLKTTPEDLREHIENYLKASMRDRPIKNQTGYAKTIIIEIWKQQTNQEHETSFEYDHEAIQYALEQTEAQMRIGNLF